MRLRHGSPINPGYPISSAEGVETFCRKSWLNNQAWRKPNQGSKYPMFEVSDPQSHVYDMVFDPPSHIYDTVSHPKSHIYGMDSDPKSHTYDMA